MPIQTSDRDICKIWHDVQQVLRCKIDPSDRSGRRNAAMLLRISTGSIYTEPTNSSMQQANRDFTLLQESTTHIHRGRHIYTYIDTERKRESERERREKGWWAPGNERTGWKKKRDRRGESDRSEKRARGSASGMVERDRTHTTERRSERENRKSRRSTRETKKTWGG